MFSQSAMAQAPSCKKADAEKTCKSMVSATADETAEAVPVKLATSCQPTANCKPSSCLSSKTSSAFQLVLNTETTETGKTGNPICPPGCCVSTCKKSTEAKGASLALKE